MKIVLDLSYILYFETSLPPDIAISTQVVACKHNLISPSPHSFSATASYLSSSISIPGYAFFTLNLCIPKKLYRQNMKLFNYWVDTIEYLAIATVNRNGVAKTNLHAGNFAILFSFIYFQASATNNTGFLQADSND